MNLGRFRMFFKDTVMWKFIGTASTASKFSPYFWQTLSMVDLWLAKNTSHLMVVDIGILIWGCIKTNLAIFGRMNIHLPVIWGSLGYQGFDSYPYSPCLSAIDLPWWHGASRTWPTWALRLLRREQATTCHDWFGSTTSFFGCLAFGKLTGLAMEIAHL